MVLKIKIVIALAGSLLISSVLTHAAAQRMRTSDFGIRVGVMEPGTHNAITDVPGVRVGHCTVTEGKNIRTGVTAVLPHGGNLFLEKVPAAIRVHNGFGKLSGITQVNENGNIEAPVILTNTLGVGTAISAVTRYTLSLPGNEEVRSVNSVVGETNDGYLNDIRGMHITEEDVRSAINEAAAGPVREGSIGAGTGTMAFGFKGGIGTASRKTPPIAGTSHHLGVLVQTNFGRELMINGTAVTSALKDHFPENPGAREEGSCMIIVATDAPVSPRNLGRIAKRAFSGMARTGTFTSSGSGDYCIAFSTAYVVPGQTGGATYKVPELIRNEAMNPLFRAVEEATQEAIYNSLFMAETVVGRNGHAGHALPLDRLKKLLGKGYAR